MKNIIVIIFLAISPSPKLLDSFIFPTSLPQMDEVVAVSWWAEVFFCFVFLSFRKQEICTYSVYKN